MVSDEGQKAPHGRTVAKQRDTKDGRGLGQLPLLIFLKFLIQLLKQS